MKSLHSRTFWTSIVSAVIGQVAMAFPDVDSCRAEQSPVSNKPAARAAVKIAVARLETNPSAPLETRALTAAAPALPKPVAILAKQDTIYFYESIPNGSIGKFIGQCSVSFAPVKGLTAGQSLAGLAFAQGRPGTPSERVYYLSAKYNPSISGFTVSADDLTSNLAGMEFATTSQVDLRFEQSPTQFILSARVTPANQNAGGWTQIYAVNATPNPLPFHAYIGVQNLLKGATAYFTNFALDGDAIGGVTEYSIITDLRSAIEALLATLSKLEAATPDFPGATTDLAIATADNNSALGKLNTALLDYSLERPLGGVAALKVVKAAAKSLAEASAAVASNDAGKTRSQIAKLRSTAGSELSAIGNMLGWAAPNLQGAPQNFFLRVP